MRKQITGPETATQREQVEDWLELEPIAQVELSSEERGYPIEAALRGGTSAGWRAESPGPQSISLVFDRPLRLRRIHLVFEEHEQQRTQEIALRWSPDGGQSYQEVLRQQYTFSPPGTIREEEDYQVNLDGVTVLTVQITPEISGGPARASLAALQLA